MLEPTMNTIDHHAVQADSHLRELLSDAAYFISKRSHVSTSRNTELQYRLNVARIERSGLKPSEMTWLTESTRAAYTSAVIWVNIARLKDLYIECQDRIGNSRNNDEFHLLVARIEAVLSVLYEYEPRTTSHVPCENNSKYNITEATSNGDKRASMPRKIRKKKTKKCKLVGIRRLPEHWKKIMFRSFNNDINMQLSLAVLELSGCRPSEIEKGVLVFCSDFGNATIALTGAKVTTDRGQPTRTIEIERQNTLAYGLLMTHLISSDCGQIIVKVYNSKAFSDRIRYRSRLLFPRIKYIISAYSYRHEFASIQKAKGVSKEILARALGHLSPASQRAYGSVQHGRSRAGYRLLTVTAARQIINQDKKNPWSPSYNKLITKTTGYRN